MYLSRRIDDKEIQLKRQNRIFFQISGAGHEADPGGGRHGAAPGHDWFYALLPRPRAHAAARHDAATRCCCRRAGAKDDPNSGGRQMPSHWGHARAERRHQVLAHRHAVPAGGRLRRGGRLRVERAADAARLGVRFAARRGRLLLHRRRHDHRGRVLGEPQHRLQPQAAGRSTWSRTTATRSRCRSRCRPPGGSISKLVRSFPDLLVREVDGCDPLASLAVMREAVGLVPRAGAAPPSCTPR